MILDILNKLSAAQAFTATAVSENTIDTGSAGNDNSIGEPLCLAVQVGVAADFSTGDETYEIQIIQSASSNLSSPDVLASRVIAASALKAGSVHYLSLSPASKSKQYLGAKLVLGGTTPSITISAYLQPQSMIQAYKAYADNITIS